MIENFNRNYRLNRAPMGFYVHAAWFDVSANHFEAYVRFVDYLNSLDDVFIVGTSDVIDWVKNPIPVQNMTTSEWSNCRKPQTTNCVAKACELWKGNEIRWMTSCQSDCPVVYPWLGNPLGVNSTKLF